MSALVCVVEKALGLPDVPAVTYLVQPMLAGEEPLLFPMCIVDSRKAEQSIMARRGETNQSLIAIELMSPPQSEEAKADG